MPWTEITRPDYGRHFLRYASDCRNDEWMLIAPFVMPTSKVGSPHKHSMRQIWNAIASYRLKYAIQPFRFEIFELIKLNPYGKCELK